MRTLQQTEYYDSRSQMFTLYHLTDTHIGARACDEDLLRRDIETIRANPYARWIGGGDFCDYVSRADEKRRNEATLAKWCYGMEDVIGVQRDRAIDLFAPIIGQCWGLVCGNHERSILKHESRDVYWELVSMLARIAGKKPQALALGVQGFIEVAWRRGNKDVFGGVWKMAIYTHHGWGSARRKGGNVNQLEMVMADYDADLYLLGHRHTRAFVDKYTVQPHGKQRYRVGLHVPSYLRAYIEPSTEDRLVDTYPEYSAMPPQHVGTLPIMVKPDVHRIDVLFSSTAGVSYLDELPQVQRETAVNKPAA